VAVVAAVACLPDVAAAFEEPRGPLALLGAAVLITAVGLADDRYGMRARHKLLGQVAAALVLVLGGGLVVERVTVFGWMVEFGLLAVPATTFWLLVCINALNLIDGMDGLLGTVGVIGLATLGVIALLAGQAFAGAVALALAGAVLGFLWFNLPPATIYMGDAGSMLIGLVIGALAVPASLKGPATVALITPVAVLILPMLDTTAAVVRRKLTGRGLATADRGHLHHVLLRGGLTVRRVLVLVAGLGLVASSGALASMLLSNDFFALVAALGVVATLVVTRMFGHAEVHLLRKRAALAVRGVLGLGPTPIGWQLAVQLQGTADWDIVWEDLVEAAWGQNLQAVALDVNAPALHENYHARWDRAGPGVPETHQWRVEIPLFSHGQPIGRLAVTGCRDEVWIGDKLQVLTHAIAAAEVRAGELTASTRAALLNHGSGPMPALTETGG
jgi:UDP-GlcNAc:undecaprenyl-phosphate GlcNAc-1-phosphate transferase